jgi:putative flippase GtrA
VGIAQKIHALLPARAVDRRFFAVAVIAFATDLVLALVFRQVFQLPIAVAAAISFLIGWLISYLLHEFWTFQHAKSRVSGGRLARNLASNGVALASRISVIFLLEQMHSPDTTLIAGLYIVVGAGCSFCVNYVLNRYWVFSRK